MLSQRQVQQVKEQGYLVVPGLFSGDEAGRAIDSQWPAAWCRSYGVDLRMMGR